MLDLALQAHDSLDALEQDWRELAQRTENIFATWEWSSVWWQHFGSDERLFIVTCRDHDDRLFAILPLSLSTKLGFRMVRFLGYGVSDELGPICAPEDKEAARRVLPEALKQLPWRYDLFLGERLPRGDGWSTALGGAILHREESPVLLANGMGWNEYLASKSSNLRQQVRRKERQLAREHGLEFRLASDPARLDDDLDNLFRLHVARWTDTTSPFIVKSAFHRHFAKRALERGWLRLWFLEIDGTPRAAWYGFRFGDVESFYQSGRDPQWAGSSIGFVLLAHTIRAALDDGVREYRFLRGGESLKYRFANRDEGLDTVGISSTLAGRIALRTSAIARAAPIGRAIRRRCNSDRIVRTLPTILDRIGKIRQGDDISQPHASSSTRSEQLHLHRRLTCQ
jgi:CelD/BcsL family acetyltransferase involved in cellulose biosynthesis